MNAWQWNGRTYRWYLDSRVAWDGSNYRIGGKFAPAHEAKQLIVASIAATALLRLPKGGLRATVYNTRSGDVLEEVSNNEYTKEELESVYQALSFREEYSPSQLSDNPFRDLEILGQWETEQENEPWYQWGGERFLISYYAILDRYVSKGVQHRGYVIEGQMQELLRTAYSEVSYRLSELDEDEAPLHTVGMFLAFLAAPSK